MNNKTIKKNSKRKKKKNLARLCPNLEGNL
jgi:hypothetical protein